MVSDFFPIETDFGICLVAESLRHFDVSLEEYLEKRKEEADPLDNFHNVSGISVRAWLCKWQRGKVLVSQGQRAEDDSSPNMNEAWGGKVDPQEKILKALIREVFEETRLVIICIYDQVGDNDVFHTPRSKRWIEQIHFLVEAKKSRTFFRGGSYLIVLSEEHQSFTWASKPLDTMTEASGKHFEEAVAKFKEKFSCPSWQKPLAFLNGYV